MSPDYGCKKAFWNSCDVAKWLDVTALLIGSKGEQFPFLLAAIGTVVKRVATTPTPIRA